MQMKPFHYFQGTNATQAEWRCWLNAYLEKEAEGLTPNEIAAAIGVTRGTACSLRRLSRELLGLQEVVYHS